MKIYVVTTGENAITVSLNGEAAVAKTVKPTITALANRNFRFECDGIDEEVESYLDIFINGQPLKGSWLSDEEWLSVALFDAIMNKTFVSGSSPGGGTSYLVYTSSIGQTGAGTPDMHEFENTIGIITPSRSGVGSYRLISTGKFTDNTYIAGSGDYNGDGVGGFPIVDVNGVIGGFYIINVTSINAIRIDVYLNDGTPVELSTIIGTAKLFLPKIEIYP